MRVKKSEIKGIAPSIFQKKEVAPLASADKSNEILAAIKAIKVQPADPVIVEQKIPDEIIQHQKDMISKAAEKPELPTYHFEINRNSEGFIKNVVASPVNVADKGPSNIADSWYSGR
tara:strand:- start:644 stop:994 length:351 start_codon:yes stop_codon:yes gene_type:complete